MQIDVVIPLGPKDEAFIDTVVQSARKYVVNLRTIFIIPYKQLEVKGTEIILESAFPFQLADVYSRISSDRAPWYLQQLLKLYAPFVIPGILPNILILDADTVLFKPIRFFKDTTALYDCNRELHAPYIDHMKRLHPSLTLWKPNTSGIVNMMILQLPVLKKLFDLVETHHGKPFWEAFLDTIDPSHRSGSGASEYEIYFHFAMRTTSSQIRHLQYDNFGFRSNVQSGGYAYRSFHWHHQREGAKA